LALASRKGALLLVGGFALLAGGSFVARRSSEFAPRRGPDAPTDWFYMQRAFPSGIIDYESRAAAIRDARALRDRAATLGGGARKAASAAWTLAGPRNIGGRITDIVADPANPSVVWAGAASGGVWKSIDAGASWAPVFDGYGSLSIGALAMSPSDPAVVYAGTGEANPGGGSVAYGGDGVWKTTDGGATWESLGLVESRYIGRIAIDPVDPSRLFVAATGDLFSKNAERGLYRSTDAGATWTLVHFVSDSTGCIDVAIDPSNPSRVFAAMWERIREPSTRRYGGVTSGIWRSEDGGDTWTLLTAGLPAASTRPGRIGIAVAPSSPATVYAIYADEVGVFAGFYRSTDSGASWTRRSDSALVNGSFYSTYGWWFGRIWVHPTDAQTVWADGLDLYKTTAGGDGCTDVNSTMHVDHHAQWIQPSNPNMIWRGNDGGMYRSTNGGTSWTHVVTIPNSQFYTCEAHLLEPLRAYGGLQDNGTWRAPVAGGLDWQELPVGGDGFVVNVDINSTSRIYAESQYGALRRSTNGGSTFSSAMSGISGADRKNWNTPVVMDPSSFGAPQTTLYYGANRLYRSTNNAASWSLASGDLSDGVPGTNGVTYGTITTIAVAPSSAQTIYAGTDDANVWVTTNGGANWTKIDGDLPERWVTRVAVDPNDAAVAYATLSGFRQDDPLAHVFRTTNRGATWSDISSNLPDAPANDIAVDPLDTSRLYVATDVGVFYTRDAGVLWLPLGSGIADGCVVTDLDHIAVDPPLLYAATYGRSMYYIDIESAIPTDVPDGGEIAGGASGAAGAIEFVTAAPNPTSAGAAIHFQLVRPARARVEVVNTSGERVATLADQAFASGPHMIPWDGLDATGRRVASGVYFSRVEAEGRAVSRKLIVAR
jgi:hypothetical protein